MDDGAAVGIGLDRLLAQGQALGGAPVIDERPAQRVQRVRAFRLDGDGLARVLDGTLI